MDPTDHSDGCVELLAEALRKVATYNIIPVRGQKNFLKIHSCGVLICGRNTSYMRQTTAGDYYTPIISGGKKDSSDSMPQYHTFKRTGLLHNRPPDFENFCGDSTTRSLKLREWLLDVAFLLFVVN